MSDTKTDKPLKIISLQAENIKRLVAVRIDPKGNLVQITGKNAQGKTSVLDAIWWALAGASNVQSTPIRKGQSTAKIKLDLGEVVVTRTFTKRDDGSAGTSIIVENGEGARFPSPQRMLDDLLGSLTFDPLAFARMKPKEQFDTLKRFVPGIDFANIEGLNRADFDKRAAVNRRAKDLAAQAAAITIPESVPAAKIDEAALVDEIQSVAAHNADITTRKERREQAGNAISAKRNEANAKRQQASRIMEAADALDAEAAALQAKLDAAEALPEPKDAAAIRAQLDDAKGTNALVDQAARRAALIADAEKAKAESGEISARMEKREEEKRAAISTAPLPVQGLGFGEDAITFNGVPFDQASDGEQLRVSCAIAMASNPRLRVIRVRDGSLLDEDALALLAEMADQHDMQVWIERVDSTGKLGFVLEDGHVRHVEGAPEPAAAQAAE